MPLFIYLFSSLLAVGSNVAFLFFLFYYFFLFLGNIASSLSLSLSLFLILFFSFDFLGLGMGVSFLSFFFNLIFILGHDFYFFSKFGRLLFFCGYLSLFCFNWASFFNKSLLVNLFKLIFFHPSTFSLSTKQKGEKIKYYISSHFSILPPFSIFTLFHHSN